MPKTVERIEMKFEGPDGQSVYLRWDAPAGEIVLRIPFDAATPPEERHQKLSGVLTLGAEALRELGA